MSALVVFIITLFDQAVSGELTVHERNDCHH